MRMRAVAGMVAALVLLGPATGRADAAMEARIAALVPDLEAVIARGMAEFHDPALAIGIVSGDRLVWGKGYGTGAGGQPVDTDTIFQIGSTTKAFLATTLAIAVDKGKLAWDDRVVDLDPGFQLKDPWVTREFRVTDIMAQRSGLPPEANDLLGFLGFDQPAMIRSLRFVEPETSFRDAFTYTNITHMLGQRVVAQAMGAADWPSLVTAEIFQPLGMTRTSLTPEAIEAGPNSTAGHLWAPDAAVEVPFTPAFPYGFGAAGGINSTVEDMAKWVRLHLGDGSFAGERIVSAENLAVTKTARVAIRKGLNYGMGWVIYETPNGTVTWHNGGTTGYGAYVGTLLDRDVGVIVLSNETNVGLPDAIGLWVLDRLLGNPEVDHLARALAAAEAGEAATRATFAAPVAPRPAPPLDGLAGRFANPNFGSVRVSAEGGRLVAEIAATGAKLALTPRDGPIFEIALVPEGPYAAIAANLGPWPLGFATFVPGPDGKVARIGIWLADAPDQEDYDLMPE